MTEKEWRELRQRIVVRDDQTCQYCGNRGHQVDYIVPTVHGGKPTDDNLVCCCGACLKAVGVRLFQSRTAKADYAKAHRREKRGMVWWQIKPKPPPFPPSRRHESLLAQRLRANRDREKNHELAISDDAVR